MSKYDTLIFSPTYNEAKNITFLIEKILELDINADILIIDDSSPDGTASLVKEIMKLNSRISIIQRPGKLGIGSAHLEAITYAYKLGYKNLITMDADFSHNPSDIPKFLLASNNASVVVGTRFLLETSIEDWTFFRKILTRAGHYATRLLLGIPFDASGAFRLYKLDQIKKSIFERLNSKNYEFFFESLYILHKSGIPILEVPIILPRRNGGQSKMSPLLMISGVIKLIFFFIRK
jgi:dolichol-phosphate mannosyltransferase